MVLPAPENTRTRALSNAQRRIPPAPPLSRRPLHLSPSSSPPSIYLPSAHPEAEKRRGMMRARVQKGHCQHRAYNSGGATEKAGQNETEKRKSVQRQKRWMTVATSNDPFASRLMKERMCNKRKAQPNRIRSCPFLCSLWLSVFIPLTEGGSDMAGSSCSRHLQGWPSLHRRKR